MGIGTAGTFAQDAQKYNLTAYDIKELTENFPAQRSEGGVYRWDYNGTRYYVRWKRSGADIELHAISTTL